MILQIGAVQELTYELITQDFLDTLAVLRPTGLTVEEARNLFHIIMTELGRKKHPNPSVWVVVNDEISTTGKVYSKVVASASLMIEQKFIRNGGVCGHIEDLAVHPDHQGEGHGRKLMLHLAGIAKARGCYKVIFDCKKELVPYYEKMGFKQSDCHMRMDFS